MMVVVVLSHNGLASPPLFPYTDAPPMLHRFRLPDFVLVLSLALAASLLGPLSPAHAVGVTSIYTFDAFQPFYPNGVTPGPDGNLYTVTTETENAFLRITPAGVATKLYVGADTAGFFAGPLLLAHDGNFYGVMPDDGSNGTSGGLYRFTPAGVLTVLHVFTGSGADGGNPQPGLVQGTDGALYGVTGSGSDHPNGTIFRCTLDGTLTTLHRFTGGADGTLPGAPLTLGQDGNFYGATTALLFRCTTTGVVTPLHTFQTNGADDLVNPGFVQDAAGNLYGTTNRGGLAGASSGAGTVFRLDPAGAVTILFNFINSGAAYPTGPLTTGPDGLFYGLTQQGGDPADFDFEEGGAIFQITPAGGVAVVFHEHTDTGLHEALAGLAAAPDGNLYAQAYGGLLQVRLATPGLLGFAAGAYTAQAGDGAAFLTLARRDDGHGAVSVDYATRDDTAHAGTDYTAASGTVRWADGDTGIKTVRVPLSNPSRSGGSVGFAVQLSNPGGGAALGVLSEVTVTVELSTGQSPGPGLGAAFVFGGGVDGYSLLHVFTGADGSLYGATGGSGRNGDQSTLFHLTPDGDLHALSDTAFLEAGGLAQGPDGNFYGTRFLPGDADLHLCRLAPDGTLTPLADLGTSTGDEEEIYRTLLPARDGTFYGTVLDAPYYEAQSTRIFHLTADGSLTTLRTLHGTSPVSLTEGTDGTLYGIRYDGGANGNGFAFRFTPAGGYQVIHDFTVNTTSGDHPGSPLVQNGNGNLYGLTLPIGETEQATFYRLNAKGRLKVLHQFDFKKEGAPAGDLVPGSDGNFYGTLVYGTNGYDGGGDTVFRVTPTGELTLLYFEGRHGDAIRLLARGTDGTLYFSNASAQSGVGQNHLYRLDLANTGTPVVETSLLSSALISSVALPGGSTKGRVQVTRTGRLDTALTLSYQVGGPARAGTDYQALSGTVKIAAGKVGARIGITPLPVPAGVPTQTYELTLKLAPSTNGSYLLSPEVTKLKFQLTGSAE